MSQSTYYFSHDYNTRTNPKIKKVLVKYGMLGYGVYWSIVEDLYNNANALPTDYDCIAYDLRVDSETVKSIINDFGLFYVSNDSFSSKSVAKRLADRDEKSAKARESAMKRWNKDANALPPQSEPNALKEIKGDEIIGEIEDDSKNKNIIPDEPEGSKKEAPVLAEKYVRFLGLFNTTCKRKFETMNDKAQRQLDKLLKKKFNSEQFTKALTNGYRDSLSWPKPGLFTPEYITREDKFELYLYMDHTDQQSPKGDTPGRGNFDLHKMLEQQQNKVYK